MKRNILGIKYIINVINVCIEKDNFFSHQICTLSSQSHGRNFSVLVQSIDNESRCTISILSTITCKNREERGEKGVWVVYAYGNKVDESSLLNSYYQPQHLVIGYSYM